MAASTDPVSLVGTTVAHFDVVAKLGEGGMGAVYRAVDTRLGREVALKVLPEDLTGDHERLARLRREAQILASLNHPNIASIFDLEEHDGRRFLVLELVEGEDLSERLRRGPLEVDEAVDFAAQIASGLEAAHDRGVIHRDLKPANVKITADGIVKVLDFGLAKPSAGGISGSGVSEMATVTGDDLTREGVIMGTAAYMSPEQARGRKVDRRTDVWAFGCVLFEMLTGVRAFGGETMTDVLVAVVSGEPDWTLVPRHTPPAVRRVLRRCLRRDPRHRLRNLGDAELELRESKDGEVEIGLDAAAVESPLPRGLAVWAVVGPLLGVALGIVVWWLVGAETAAVPRSPRFLATVSGPVAVYDAYAPSLTGAAGGRELVYAAGRPPRLVRQVSDQLDPVPIPGTEGALAPFVLGDGSSLAFWADGALRRVPRAGGTAVVLCETDRYFFGAAWADDGFVYFSRPWVVEDGTIEVALVRIADSGGTVELVASAEPEDGRVVGLVWPAALPGSRHLLVTRSTTSGAPPAIEVVSTADGSRKTVIEGYQQARYVPSGHLVAGTPEGRLFALPFDADKREVTGEPIPIGAGVHRGRYGVLQFAVASDGAVYWVPEVGSTRPDELVWVDRSGRVEPASSHLRDYETPRFTADRLITVVVRSADDTSGVWLLDPVRDTLRPLTVGAGSSSDPLWIPGGKGLIFSLPLGTPDLPAGIYRRSLDEPAPPERLVAGPLRTPTTLSADGMRLIYHTIGASSGWDLWQVSVTGDRTTTPLLTAPHDQLDARFAPGDEWIAFTADVSGRSEVYVRQLGASGIEGQVSPHGGSSPVWSPRGDELFYLGRQQMMSVRVTLDSTPSAEPARPLFPLDGFAGSFDVAPDGDHFLMIRLGQEPAGRQINVALDWLGGAKSRNDGGGR